MRTVSSWRKDRFDMGVSTALSVAAEPAVTFNLSLFYNVGSKTRDRAWVLGDQAMKKWAISRGCF
jgi:hypothetical protein